MYAPSRVTQVSLGLTVHHARPCLLLLELQYYCLFGTPDPVEFCLLAAEGFLHVFCFYFTFDAINKKSTSGARIEPRGLQTLYELTWYLLVAGGGEGGADIT